MNMAAIFRDALSSKRFEDGRGGVVVPYLNNEAGGDERRAVRWVGEDGWSGTVANE